MTTRRPSRASGRPDSACTAAALPGRRDWLSGGLAAIFVVGMAYRTLADSRLGGALVVVALLAGALALGGIMTAMLLGHWYLNTPTASGKPLEFSTTLTLVALGIAFVCALLLGPSTLKLHDPGVALSPGTTHH